MNGDDSILKWIRSYEKIWNDDKIYFLFLLPLSHMSLICTKYDAFPPTMLASYQPTFLKNIERDIITNVGDIDMCIHILHS